jgi:hypothetical protein
LVLNIGDYVSGFSKVTPQTLPSSSRLTPPSLAG